MPLLFHATPAISDIGLLAIAKRLIDTAFLLFNEILRVFFIALSAISLDFDFSCLLMRISVFAQLGLWAAPARLIRYIFDFAAHQRKHAAGAQQRMMPVTLIS